MEVAVGLGANGLNHCRCAMPHVEATQASSEVEEAVAVHVLDHGPFRARNEDWGDVVNGARHAVLAPLHPALGFRAGNRRAKLYESH
jgi:hypothetical protein